MFLSGNERNVKKLSKTSGRKAVGDEKRIREGVLGRLVVLAPPKLED